MAHDPARPVHQVANLRRLHRDAEIARAHRRCRRARGAVRGQIDAASGGARERDGIRAVAVARRQAERDAAEPGKSRPRVSVGAAADVPLANEHQPLDIVPCHTAQRRECADRIESPRHVVAEPPGTTPIPRLNRLARSHSCG